VRTAKMMMKASPLGVQLPVYQVMTVTRETDKQANKLFQAVKIPICCRKVPCSYICQEKLFFMSILVIFLNPSWQIQG
jgi:hypothetical protein